MSSETKTPKPLKGTKLGVVVGDKRDKTRTVQVDRQITHPKYGKLMRRVGRYHVHDEGNVSRVGDQVEIVNCRPISKTKNWRLVRVVQKAPEGAEITHVTGGE